MDAASAARWSRFEQLIIQKELQDYFHGGESNFTEQAILDVLGDQYQTGVVGSNSGGNTIFRDRRFSGGPEGSGEADRVPVEWRPESNAFGDPIPPPKSDLKAEMLELHQQVQQGLCCNKVKRLSW